MKTLTQQCLVYVGELAHKFAEQDFADLPLTILSQILPYLSAAQLHRLDDVFKQTGRTIHFIRNLGLFVLTTGWREAISLLYYSIDTYNIKRSNIVYISFMISLLVTEC